MSADDKVKAEMRLQAIEYVLSQLQVTLYQLFQISSAKAREQHEDILARLAKQTFPGVPPELSDHAASELHEAVDRLLMQQRVMLAEVRNEMP